MTSTRSGRAYLNRFVDRWFRCRRGPAPGSRAARRPIKLRLYLPGLHQPVGPMTRSRSASSGNDSPFMLDRRGGKVADGGRPRELRSVKSGRIISPCDRRPQPSTRRRRACREPARWACWWRFASERLCFGAGSPALQPAVRSAFVFGGPAAGPFSSGKVRTGER